MLHPITLHIHPPTQTTQTSTHEVSICKTVSVADLKQKVCEKLDLPKDDFDLVDYYQKSPGKVLVNLEQTLEDAGLLHNQDVLLQGKTQPQAPQDDDQANSRALILVPTDGCNGITEDVKQQGTNRLPGLVGLSNLGNTCYMNSSLQCLLHTLPLMRRFLSGQFKEDLNRTNPLGQKGELAESFASVMSSVWRSDLQYVTPRSFKMKIGRFCPVFTGYDSKTVRSCLHSCWTVCTRI